MAYDISYVYADVNDFGALGTGFVDDSSAIRAAIADGREVLFPAGTYRFDSIVDFSVANARCTFLSGAILVPGNEDAFVRISGVSQTFMGLRIEAPPDLRAHSPLLEIDGAAKLLLEELRVSVTLLAAPVSGPMTAVKIMNLVKCKLFGGAIQGNRESGTVGLWFASSYVGWPENTAAPYTSGAYETGAFGLTIQAFGWAVRIGCVCDDPSFVDCSFVDNVDGAVIVRDDADAVQGTIPTTPTVATAFNLIGCHMGGASPLQYVQVDETNSWAGGVVMGCSFGPDSISLSKIRPLVLGPPDPADPAPWVRWADPADPLPGVDGATGGGAIRGGARQIPTVAVASAASASGRGGGVVPGAPDIVQGKAAIQDVPGQGAAGGRTSGELTPQISRPGQKVFTPRATGSWSSAGRKMAIAGNHANSVVQAGSGTRPFGESDSCIFRIAGRVRGVVVSGCHSELPTRRQNVWNITGEASGTCDMFNAWAEASLATGGQASDLVSMTANDAGELTLTAHTLSVDAQSVGFFGTTPGSRGAKYTVHGRRTTGDRSLTTTNVDLVLGQLLMDLSVLGLVQRRMS